MGLTYVTLSALLVVAAASCPVQKCRSVPPDNSLAPFDFITYNNGFPSIWYEIASTAQYKLQQESGLICTQLRWNYHCASCGGYKGPAGGSEGTFDVTTTGLDVAGYFVKKAVLKGAKNADVICQSVCRISSQLLSGNTFDTRLVQAALSKLQSLTTEVVTILNKAHQFLVPVNEAGQRLERAVKKLQNTAASLPQDFVQSVQAVNVSTARILGAANRLKGIAKAMLSRKGNGQRGGGGVSVQSAFANGYFDIGEAGLVPGNLYVQYDNYAVAPWTVVNITGSSGQYYSAALIYVCGGAGGGPGTLNEETWFVLSRNRTVSAHVMRQFETVVADVTSHSTCDNALVPTVQDSTLCESLT